jgi:hypothetical protein
VSDRAAANAEAVRRLCASEPRAVDVRPGGEVVPGFAPNLILTSGAPLPFAAYHGGQREAIIGAAQFEGLAASPRGGDRGAESGAIRVDGCHGLRLRRLAGRRLHRLDAGLRGRGPRVGRHRVLQLLRGQGAAPA